MAAQVARQLDRGGPGVADEGQQHLDDQRRVEIGGAGHAVPAGCALAVGDDGIGGQIDEDAVHGLALDASAAHGGEQEGARGDVEQGVKLLGRPAGLGLVDQARHGGGEAALAGEACGAQREQPEAVEALRVGAGVEASVVVVTAQIGDLAEVAEGGGWGGVGEGGLELWEGERVRGGEGGGEHGSSALGHVTMVWHEPGILDHNSSPASLATGRNQPETGKSPPLAQAE